MKLGTKSLLWGAHAFFLHPFQVGWGWSRLWKFPWDPRLWVCFFFHDVGYIMRDQMDGDGSEEHVILGAEIVRSICGPEYADECYRHSREWCRRWGQPVSRLCLADKMAFVLVPWWLYLPMTCLTGELTSTCAGRERNIDWADIRKKSENWSLTADAAHG